MKAVIVSDLHFGSPFSRIRPFNAFLDALPPDVTLIMNGDVVDKWNEDLKGEHLATLNRLVEISKQRTVVWIRGNHDEQYPIPTAGKIRIEEDAFTIAGALHITHGDHFDFVMPNNKLFMKFFRSVHRLRIRLGAPSMHVATYAKRFPRLYHFLTERVKSRAVRYAHKHGHPAITCGHTHYMEDTMFGGIRYLNTGSWTEDPPMCIRVLDSRIDLVEAATAFST